MENVEELKLAVRHTHKINMIVCSVTNYLINHKDEFTFDEVEQFLESIKSEMDILKNEFLDKGKER